MCLILDTNGVIHSWNQDNKYREIVCYGIYY